MSKVSTDAPDQPEKETTVLRQFDTSKSDAHVAQLLHIAEQASKYLWSRQEVGEVIDVDKTLQDESRETLRLVHVRLRDLIDETPRWSLAPTATERESSKLVNSTLELYGEKVKNAKIYNRPSIFLRPKIARFEVGWIAWIGGDTPLKKDLHGIGASPELALEAFDQAYRTLEKIADAQPAVVVPPPAPKRAPRKPRKT